MSMSPPQSRRRLVQGTDSGGCFVVVVSLGLAQPPGGGGCQDQPGRSGHSGLRAAKCVALTFDDGPTPFTDRLLRILNDNDAKGNVLPDRQTKLLRIPRPLAVLPRPAWEIGGHTWEHPNMTTIPEADIPTAQQGDCSNRRGHGAGSDPVPARWRVVHSGPYRSRPSGLAEIPLGRHPVRLDQRFQHRRHPLHAHESGQARFGCPVARHLLQHCGSGLPVPTGTQGQWLPWSPSAISWENVHPDPATAAVTTGRRLTTSRHCVDQIPARPRRLAEAGLQPAHHRHPQPESRRAQIAPSAPLSPRPLIDA